MFKQFIYIEKQIAEHENTKRVLTKFTDAKIVYIDHYKDVFNQSGSEWRLQKQAQKLILAKRTDHFYYKGSNVTPDFGFKNFYYNTLALNCVYDCDYCYLQGLFSSAHFVLFVNNEDFISETIKLINQSSEQVYLALSYDTDLLAIENWLPYCKTWIDFAASQQNLTIEIRTKSANYKSLEYCKPVDNVVLAWTLSPQEIINLNEAKTPSLIQRLKAIKAFQTLGWKIRLCFDPLLIVKNWRAYYKEMLKLLQQEIDIDKIDTISLGVFRMNKLFLKNMQRRREDTSVLYYPYELNEDIYTYNKYEKEELQNYLIEQLLNINANFRIEII
ncbi:MAG: DNA photolyase [Bacteroidetes bacterium]|nr:DNA photolyase [Bacteroidota bacterium]MCA6442413.1 DNA photolyase [Bacteroidota bacterium]